MVEIQHCKLLLDRTDGCMVTMDGEAGDARPSSEGSSRPMLFKKKSKARASAGGAASSRGSLLQSSSTEAVDDEPHNEGDEVVAIRRTAGIGGTRGRATGSESKMAARKARTSASSSALSFNDGSTNEPSFELKKSALAQAARKRQEAASLPDSLDQASIEDASSGYSVSALAALKASTPARKAALEEEDGVAHLEMVDPATQYDQDGSSLTRMKFGAGFAEQGIPNEAVIAAAKERRRRAAEDGFSHGQSTDYISLREDNNQGPHPESRLPREEDEVGSGEEDFAQYTGATERVALGQKAINQARERERNERREAMDVDDSDDSGQEWERAQMDRIGTSMMSRKAKEKRERSPFRPAPIPMTAPLPTLTSTSARLATRVAALDSSIQNHNKVVDDAVRQLHEMEGDEKRNKAMIEVASEKEAWFRELENFIISLANFLDEKMPRLQEMEHDWTGILTERTRMVQNARATRMVDELCLFHGVPAKSLQPTSGMNEEDVEGNPFSVDGEAVSSVREGRRALATSSVDSLNPADEAAFQVAHRDILRRLRQLLDDVNAPEFTDPAVRIEAKLHPSSLVSRFHQWRSLFPQEYGNAWGGLTLAGIWDFWVRKELCGWDFVKEGRTSIDTFVWHKEMLRYFATSSNGNGEGVDGEDDGGGALGGDDEGMSHAISNTVIPRIIDALQAGSVDVWSAIDMQSMVDLLEQIGYVLERDNAQFQSIVSSLLLSFDKHITVIVAVLSNPPISPPPPFDPRAPASLLSYIERVKVLLFNVTSLNRFVPPSERVFYLTLIDRLVGQHIWTLLVTARETGGSKGIAGEILAKCSRGNLLSEDVRSRLAAMSAN